MEISFHLNIVDSREVGIKLMIVLVTFPELIMQLTNLKGRQLALELRMLLPAGFQQKDARGWEITSQAVQRQGLTQSGGRRKEKKV